MLGGQEFRRNMNGKSKTRHRKNIKQTSLNISQLALALYPFLVSLSIHLLMDTRLFVSSGLIDRAPIIMGKCLQ